MQQPILDRICDQLSDPGRAVDQEPTLVGVTHYPDRFRGASEGGCGDIAQLAEICWGRHGVKLHQQLRNDLGRR